MTEEAIRDFLQRVRRLEAEVDRLKTQGSAGSTGGTLGQHGNDYHTPDMALASHNHAGVYSDTAHNHSGVYSPVGHTHAPGTREAVITFGGTLTVSSGPFRVYNQSGSTRTITKVALGVATAPTGAAIIVDIHKNGTTIFTTQANRPQITATNNSGSSSTIDVTSWAAGEYLTADVDQIGSGTAGEYLVVHIFYTE